jgi:hypothetical protein
MHAVKLNCEKVDSSKNNTSLTYKIALLTKLTCPSSKALSNYTHNYVMLRKITLSIGQSNVKNS